MHINNMQAIIMCIFEPRIGCFCHLHFSADMIAHFLSFIVALYTALVDVCSATIADGGEAELPLSIRFWRTIRKPDDGSLTSVACPDVLSVKPHTVALSVNYIRSHLLCDVQAVIAPCMILRQVVCALRGGRKRDACVPDSEASNIRVAPVSIVSNSSAQLSS